MSIYIYVYIYHNHKVVLIARSPLTISLSIRPYCFLLQKGPLDCISNLYTTDKSQSLLLGLHRYVFV